MMGDIPQTGVLTPAIASAFLSRYQHFFDGLIRGVQIRLDHPADQQDGHDPHGVLVECSVLDTQRASPENWVNILLCIEAAEALRLILGNHTWMVLTEGLSIGFFEEGIHLAFDAQVQTHDEFLLANFLVVGARCTWTLLPYRKTLSDALPDTR